MAFPIFWFERVQSCQRRAASQNRKQMYDSIFKEALNNSELPAAQGRAAKINDVESLIL
jgi:hypothetical protein